MNYAIAPDQAGFDAWVASSGGHIDPASVTFLSDSAVLSALADVPGVTVHIVSPAALSGAQQALAASAWAMVLGGHLVTQVGPDVPG